MRCALLALLCAGGAAAALPKLTYTRSFPGSDPAWFQIQIDHDGALEYKESPTDEHPVKAQLTPTEAGPLFADAEKLNYFKSPLESGLKVANTGKKTFRYEAADGTPSEAVFNYSTDEIAHDLLERFENIAASEHAYLQLDSTAHYDKLGVNDALANIESLWLHKQLAAPQQFIPLLTRISTHESYMHLVRERAARLKDQFQNVSAAAAADSKSK
ncbi:MAG: hypothetical protein JO270_06790 [Acidobacteriaceae bacterium]|nr:hypothetical protein [Acidobacteriaceae bacterium]